MGWKKFFLLFLRNAVISLGIATLLVGLLGLFLAGPDGFVRGAGWGFVLGLIIVPGTLAVMIYARYWGDAAGRFSARWFKEQAEGEEKPHKRW